MTASISSAFSPNGPFRFQAPTEFVGKKDHFEYIIFKVKAYLSMILNASFKKAVDRIAEKLRWMYLEITWTPKETVVGTCWRWLHSCNGS